MVQTQTQNEYIRRGNELLISDSNKLLVEKDALADHSKILLRQNDELTMELESFV